MKNSARVWLSLALILLCFESVSCSRHTFLVCSSGSCSKTTKVSSINLSSPNLQLYVLKTNGAFRRVKTLRIKHRHSTKTCRLAKNKYICQTVPLFQPHKCYKTRTIRSSCHFPYSCRNYAIVQRRCPTRRKFQVKCPRRSSFRRFKLYRTKCLRWVYNCRRSNSLKCVTTRYTCQRISNLVRFCQTHYHSNRPHSNRPHSNRPYRPCSRLYHRCRGHGHGVRSCSVLYSKCRVIRPCIVRYRACSRYRSQGVCRARVRKCVRRVKRSRDRRIKGSRDLTRSDKMRKRCRGVYKRCRRYQGVTVCARLYTRCIQRLKSRVYLGSHRQSGSHHPSKCDLLARYLTRCRKCRAGRCVGVCDRVRVLASRCQPPHKASVTVCKHIVSYRDRCVMIIISRGRSHDRQVTVCRRVVRAASICLKQHKTRTIVPRSKVSRFDGRKSEDWKCRKSRRICRRYLKNATRKVRKCRRQRRRSCKRHFRRLRKMLRKCHFYRKRYCRKIRRKHSRKYRKGRKVRCSEVRRAVLVCRKHSVPCHKLTKLYHKCRQQRQTSPQCVTSSRDQCVTSSRPAQLCKARLDHCRTRNIRGTRSCLGFYYDVCMKTIRYQKTCCRPGITSPSPHPTRYQHGARTPPTTHQIVLHHSNYKPGYPRYLVTRYRQCLDRAQRLTRGQHHSSQRLSTLNSLCYLRFYSRLVCIRVKRTIARSCLSGSDSDSSCHKLRSVNSRYCGTRTRTRTRTITPCIRVRGKLASCYNRYIGFCKDRNRNKTQCHRKITGICRKVNSTGIEKCRNWVRKRRSNRCRYLIKRSRSCKKFEKCTSRFCRLRARQCGHVRRISRAYGCSISKPNSPKPISKPNSPKPIQWDSIHVPIHGSKAHDNHKTSDVKKKKELKGDVVKVLSKSTDRSHPPSKTVVEKPEEGFKSKRVIQKAGEMVHRNSSVTDKITGESKRTEKEYPGTKTAKTSIKKTEDSKPKTRKKKAPQPFSAAGFFKSLYYKIVKGPEETTSASKSYPNSKSKMCGRDSRIPDPKGVECG